MRCAVDSEGISNGVGSLLTGVDESRHHRFGAAFAFPIIIRVNHDWDLLMNLCRYSDLLGEIYDFIVFTLL